MPLYDYACKACGRTTEILQRYGDPPLAICPHCGGEMRKLLSAPAFHFKGSGFYATDYAAKKGSGASSGDGSASGEPAGGAKSEKSESKGSESPTASSTSSSKSESSD